jgi:hypothetical protein
MSRMLGISDAIQKSPWTRPLNWKLHTTIHGEPQIPFSHYIQLEPTQSSCPALPRFRTLPAELQLHILSFCDSPTLFQLMQVSSVIRVEAKKLFWSYPDAWYWVEGNWLLAGGFSGCAHHAIDFLAHVEQVEVDFRDMDDLRRDWDAENRRGYPGAPIPPSQGVEDQIRDFWQALQHRFPRVTNVVVSESRIRSINEALLKDLKMMVEMCPAGINASASFLRKVQRLHKRLERSLWRQAGKDASIAHGWEKISPNWTRKSILLPPKEFRGPVGAYESIQYNDQRYDHQRTANRLLLIEAVERSHFHERHEPFNCYFPDCEARFVLPGEWTLHAIDSGHTYCDTPDEFKALFDQHKKMLKQMSEQYGPRNRIQENWGEEGSEKRRNAEQAFLYQLDHDPLYAQGKPAKECFTWFLYAKCLNEKCILF